MFSSCQFVHFRRDLLRFISWLIFVRVHKQSSTLRIVDQAERTTGNANDLPQTGNGVTEALLSRNFYLIRPNYNSWVELQRFGSNDKLGDFAERKTTWRRDGRLLMSPGLITTSFYLRPKYKCQHNYYRSGHVLNPPLWKCR